jgi:uncharacterized protein (DUF1697 family)
MLAADELIDGCGRGRRDAELSAYAGKPVGVLVRTASELARVLANNPFPDAAANRSVVIFRDGPLSAPGDFVTSVLQAPDRPTRATGVTDD